MNGRMGSDSRGKCCYEEPKSIAQESGADYLDSNIGCGTFLLCETQSMFLSLSEPQFPSVQNRQRW